jgi:hypothetical protein
MLSSTKRLKAHRFAQWRETFLSVTVACSGPYDTEIICLVFRMSECVTLAFAMLSLGLFGTLAVPSVIKYFEWSCVRQVITQHCVMLCSVEWLWLTLLTTN